ncbi:MAG TPA: EAL domain-containing protein [Allosphingosinicella sp.]|jgi:diguanylate cyclase (GGDEF)-like protein/PAS domain S-box-containing protein
MRHIDAGAFGRGAAPLPPTDGPASLAAGLKGLLQREPTPASPTAVWNVSGSRIAALEKTLDMIPHMLWRYDPTTQETYYSEHWQRFTGERIGHGLNDALRLVHPDDQDGVARQWLKSLSNGEAYEAEYRLRHHRGGYRWVLSRGNPERHETGEIVAWYGVLTDIHELAEAREALQAGTRRFRNILNSIPQIAWSMSADGNRADYFNERWYEFTGLPSGSLHGPAWKGVFHPEDRKRGLQLWLLARRAGKDFDYEHRIRDRDGNYRWVISRARAQRSASGSVVRWYGTCTDIHERVAAKRALEASEQLNRAIIEASPDCVSLLDLSGNRLFVNDATLRCYGFERPEQLIGTRWGVGFPIDVRPAAADALACAQRGEIGRLVVQMGAEARWWDIVIAPIQGEGGKPVRLAVISRDVTQQREAQERAQWSASHDSLTGLPNRFLLQRRLDEAIAHAETTGEGFALFLLDVDDFKRVNDTVGHDAGDALLLAFAQRLQAGVRDGDTVARLGGDEFAILLRGTTCEIQLTEAYERLRDKLREPCIHAGRVMECGASIGASLYPRDGGDRSELLKNADLALYSTKAAGGAGLSFFRPQMRMEMQKRASMLSLAHTALREDRIVPHYQPKVDLRSGARSGFEALLRWRHPRWGMQLPSTVSAAFEDLNLAAEISDCMIAAVIRDIRCWLDDGVEFGHVAVNASAAEFRRGDFAERLLERLDKAGVPAECFQLEVTETVFLGRGAEYVERALKMLSAAGVAIALDDFGTGYASLSHLKQFPVHILKIDRSFVADLHSGGGGVAIVNAVVGLGRSLGIQTVAEGVETEAQHEILAGLGCDYGQGFLYGKAIAAREVTRLCTGAEAWPAAVGGN